MIRVTTNNTLWQYQTNLNKSANQLYSAMGKMMTGRNFDSYAANPAGATRAFKIYSSLNATNAQAANNQTVTNKFSTAYSSLDQIADKVYNEMGSVPSLTGLNDPNLSNLGSLAQILNEGADAIVQMLNGKYSNDYLFNGAETGEAPFEIQNDAISGTRVLTFRGWKVDVPDNNETYLDPDGNQVTENGKTLTNADVYQKLQDMSNEALWVDIGMGFQVDAGGKVVENTAYNSALSGLDIMDFGVDKDGDPKNAVSIMLRIADVFSGYVPAEGTTAGHWGAAGDHEDSNRLVGKLQDSHEKLVDKWSELSGKVTYLNSNQTRLNETFENLDVERGSIEDIDTADAIMQLVWAQTTYNAALQVGANVIPQSLMDYLQ